MAVPAGSTASPALARAVAEFNSWRFYDCHETLEDIWRAVGGKGDESTVADFYQGIIKIAAGFHHLIRGNYKGVVNLLSDSFRLLERFQPEFLGVDVGRLVRETRACLDRVLELGSERLAEFDRSLIPAIHAVPEGNS